MDRELFYSRLRAAVAARNNLQSDMLIIARTDSRQSLGFDEAAERLKEAVKIGVDVVFLEALQSTDEARRICEIMGDVPVLLNMVPGSTTPDITVDEAKELGFRIIIFPGLSLAPVMLGVQAELEHLKTKGFVSPTSSGQGVKGLFNLCGLQECIDIDKSAGGRAYADVGK